MSRRRPIIADLTPPSDDLARRLRESSGVHRVAPFSSGKRMEIAA